jgi:antitoxin ParD1/3/4
MPMNVSLTAELERLIRDKVASGRYSSTSEVVREALRLLEQRDIAQTDRRDALRKAWAKGINSGLAEGDLDFAAIKHKARSRLKRKRAKA